MTEDELRIADDTDGDRPVCGSTDRQLVAALTQRCHNRIRVGHNVATDSQIRDMLYELGRAMVKFGFPARYKR